MDAVKQEKSRIDKAGLVQLKKAILSNPEVIGAGLQKWIGLETINQVFLGGRKPQAALTALTGTEKNAFIEIIELFQPE